MSKRERGKLGKSPTKATIPVKDKPVLPPPVKPFLLTPEPAEDDWASGKPDAEVKAKARLEEAKTADVTVESMFGRAWRPSRSGRMMAAARSTAKKIMTESIRKEAMAWLTTCRRDDGEVADPWVYDEELGVDQPLWPRDRAAGLTRESIIASARRAHAAQE